MGLYNISYKDKERDELIDAEMGTPYSLLSKIKLGGIGSRRLIIENMSVNMSHLKSKVADLQYGSIELRPQGIIVHVNLGLDVFAWTIPFYRLSIYNGDFFTIHGNGDYLQFNKEKSWAENNVFIKKMLRLKLESSHSQIAS
tara:strand:- start:219 stop:644 length:426 start_codon:yes stop_codon:yes gene_type:complete